MRDNARGGALTEVTFFILLALYRPKHGYAIMQFIEEKTGGRLVLGAGTLFGLQILPQGVEPVAILASPPGGFFVFGVLMALAILLDQKRGKKVDADPEKMGCAGCPNSKKCNGEGGCE